MKPLWSSFLAKLLAVLCFTLVGPAHSDPVPLGETARVIVGDDRAYADPSFDDSSWDIQPIVERKGWRARGATLLDTGFWQRITFDGRAVQDLAEPALYFGVVAGSHAVYLNGVKIGGMALYDPMRAGQRSTQFKAMPRVYAVPKDLVLTDKPNVLAIRFVRLFTSQPGVISLPFEITERSVAIQNAAPKTIRFVLFSAGVTLLLVVASIGAMIAYALAYRDLTRFWILVTGLSLLSYYTITLSYSIVLDWMPPPWLHLLTVKIYTVAYCAALEIVRRVLAKPLNFFVKVLYSLVFLTAFLSALPGLNLSLAGRVFELVNLAGGCIAFSTIGYWATKDALLGVLEAWPLSLSSVPLAISMAAFGLLPELPLLLTVGTPSIYVTPSVFGLSLAFLPIISLFRSQRKLAEAQALVLRAQEEERRSVAYDIHDGIGQWLSAIKLGLQIFKRQSEPKEGDLDDVLSHVDTAIADTRRIAHNLSPAMIEKHGLWAALQSHADLLNQRGTVKVVLDGGPVTNVGATEQGHLLRIVQEASRNAVQHGRATMMNVTLKQTPLSLRLIIEDNGSGWSNDKEGNGLGLESFKRRAEVLGGSLDLGTSESGGTRVALNVPTER